MFGDVTQPLFAVGKLWKVGWGLDPLDQFNAFLKKGGARVPVRFVRNSTVTDLKIYRAQVKVIKEDEQQVRKLTLIKQMEEDFEKMKYHEGWFSCQMASQQGLTGTRTRRMIQRTMK